MPYTCFSYSSDVPPGIRNRGAAQQAVPGLRRMPVGPCFSYSPGLSARDLRRMPVWACFSYPADLPPGVRKRNAAP